MPAFAVRSTKTILSLLTRVIKADVRLHNADVIKPDMSIIFVVNHFTRLETVLLPYIIWKHTGLDTWSLAAGDLFGGRVGAFLRSVGTISTQDPDRDKIIVRSLLAGEHPWIIFPEGMMMKDKKIIDPQGNFLVYQKDFKTRRPPHTGAAVLALRAEYFRHKLGCLCESSERKDLTEILARFGLDSYEQAAGKRTVLIPVNITYFPLRARENILYDLATRFSTSLSERALEEISIESSILSKDSNIDITLGQPIDIRSVLESPDNKDLMDCGAAEMDGFEQDPGSRFNELARTLMLRYMNDIYQLTTLNFDHVFATIIRMQTAAAFTERAYRNRIFLCIREILALPNRRVHSLLPRHYRDILFEDPSPRFHDFMTLCLREKIIERRDDLYVKNFELERGVSEFHEVRTAEPTWVIANEIEPLTDVVAIVRRYARASRAQISARIREIMFEEDLNIFEEDYKTYAPLRVHPKPPDIARPFLLRPKRIRAGIVLVHGYLAAPEEIRRMAEHFYALDYAVYGVRLKGHGTAPEDLARTQWEDWYESMNRGYAVIKSLTDDIVLGGFSTGGCLALLAAGRKQRKIRAVFSVNAPLQLRNFAVHLLPSVSAVNTLMSRFRKKGPAWEFVQNNPENVHINYQRNPVTGVRELSDAMTAMERALPDIVVPTLIMQGSLDPVVDPSSGRMIFQQVGTRDKELLILERSRHGIINGEGAEDVYDRIEYFLKWAFGRSAIERSPDYAAKPEGPVPAAPMTAPAAPAATASAPPPPESARAAS